MNETILGGKAEVAIGVNTIPAELLSDIVPNFIEGTRETTTLAGTRTQPSGSFETAELGFTMYVQSMDYFKYLFPDEYNLPSGTQTTGNLIFGASSCTTKEPVVVNIHYTCDDTDDNDVQIFSALVAMNFNPTYNDSDGLSVEVTVYAQPTDAGYFRLGTGDLTQPSIWDAETQETVPIGS